MNEPQEIEANASRPPAGVLQGKHVIRESLITRGQLYPITDHIEHPEGGGILIYYKGMPFPRKGHPFPEAVYANDNQKRITRFLIMLFEGKETLLPLAIFALLPWKLKLKKIEKVLSEYARIGIWILNEAFLTPIYYTAPSREIGAFVYDFLISLGVQKEMHHIISDEGKDVGMKRNRLPGAEPTWVTMKDNTGTHLFSVAQIVATMIEYDDAYRYRLEDIMSETTKEALIENPQKEIRRLTAIFMSREKTHAKDMIKRMSKFVCFALYHPRIKKAFRDGLRTLDFKRLQLDNADRYHVLIRSDYDFKGLDFNDRKRIYTEFHMESKCHGKLVRLSKDKDGNTVGGKCTECFKELEPEDVKFDMPPMLEVTHS